MPSVITYVPDAGEQSPNFLFSCPACLVYHGIRVGPGQWSWNGSVETPTIEPSILVTGREHLTDAEIALLMSKAVHKIEKPKTVCHSYVRNGQIEFLPDCTHSLAGKTIQLSQLTT